MKSMAILVGCAALLSVGLGCGDDTGDGTSSASGGSGGSSAGGSSAGGSSAGGSSAGGSSAGGQGGGTSGVNGCTEAGADDMTGMATVTLAWALPHQQCIIVDVGTEVVWEGSFGPHPLAGGETGSVDGGNPITGVDQGGATASVTFDTAGDYPYFCTIHNGSMQGVVFVN